VIALSIIRAIGLKVDQTTWRTNPKDIHLCFNVCRIIDGAHNENRQMTSNTMRVSVYALQLSVLYTAYCVLEYVFKCAEKCVSNNVSRVVSEPKE
jgi:hypothetical protein